MKKLLFAAFALMLAVGVSAFVSQTKSAQSKKAVTTAVWFYFQGSPGEESDLSKYVQDPNQQNDCEITGTDRCSILAPPIQSGPDAGKPDLNSIQDEKFRP